MKQLLKHENLCEKVYLFCTLLFMISWILSTQQTPHNFAFFSCRKPFGKSFHARASSISTMHLNCVAIASGSSSNNPLQAIPINFNINYRPQVNMVSTLIPKCAKFNIALALGDGFDHLLFVKCADG